MKIALVSIGFRPYRTSGLDVSAEHLAGGLLSRGHEVTIFTGRRGEIREELSHPNLRMIRIELGKTDWIGFGFSAAKTLSGSEVWDVVHFLDVHFAWAYHGDYVASLQHSFHQRLESIGRFREKPGLGWLYRYLYYSLARTLAEKPALKRARGLLAGSATSRAEFIDNYRVQPTRIALARHGIDLDKFQPLTGARESRAKYGLGPEDPVLLFSGFITPRKSLEYLALALPHIHPIPKLLLVGEWRSEAYRQQVIKAFGSLWNQVIELGYVPDQEMPVIFSLADVYVTTSMMEGFGFPPAEALACGTPVVAMETGAVREVIGPGGRLVPARDYISFARAVTELLNNPPLRQKLAAEGCEYVNREFSIPLMVESTLEAYQQFI